MSQTRDTKLSIVFKWQSYFVILYANRVKHNHQKYIDTAHPKLQIRRL